MIAPSSGRARHLVIDSDEMIRKRGVMTYFGHVCACPDCGERRLEELTLDHITRGGNAERRQLRRQGSSWYVTIQQHIDGDDQPWLKRLRILCHACHRSTTKHGSCMIDHVLAGNDQTIQDDADVTASTDQKGNIGRNSRQLAATVQFSARISEELKARIDRHSNGGQLTYAQVLERLLNEVDSDVLTLCRDLRTIMMQVETSQRDMLARLSDLCLKGNEPTPQPQEFPWLTPEGIVAAEQSARMESAPSLIVMPSPTRWRRLLGWLWTY